MKRSLPLALLLGFSVLFGTMQTALSQVSLPHYEGFEYTIGTGLQTQGGWTPINTGDDLLITEGSLSYPGYIASKGNKVAFAGKGIDALKSITPYSTGTIYYSFILKVTDISSATDPNAGYFIGFAQNSNNFGSTIWIKKNGDNFNIGIAARTSVDAVLYSTETFTINTEMLLVAAYQLNSEAGDDVASLWINPQSSSFGSTEVPAATLTVTNTGGNDLSTVSHLLLRQDSEGETPAVEIDEIRISETWENVVPLTAATDNTAPAFSAGFPTVSNINATQADLEVSMDEAGTAYFVVVPDGATAPTVDEVVAGTNYGTVTLIANGTIDVTAGGGTYTAAITGLTDKTDYDIYVVAEDDEDTPNRQTESAKVDLYTIRPPDVLLNADFETSGSPAPFTQVSITGDQVWEQYTYSGESFARISGYSGEALENEDWLISPAVNVSSAESVMLSFITAVQYPGGTFTVKISSDFSGTYTATDIAAATWTDITSNFALSTGSFAWTSSGDYSLDAYTGEVYIAFVYTSTSEGAATWEVDNVRITGYLLPGSDATLSDLKVDGATLESFDPATLSYEMILDASVTTPPAVTFTTTDATATAVVTDATDLAGDAAARTTTVVVTAADGTTTKTYSILFNPIIAVTDLAALRAVASENYGRVYQVTGEVIVSGLNDSQRHQKYVQDATAGVLIDDAGSIITTAYSIGDGITGLTGTLSEYNKLLQFIPYRDPGAASSSNNTLTPEEVTVAEFTGNQENYESELVTIIGVAFADANGTAAFKEKTNYSISAGSDATILRTIFLGTDLNDKVIPYMADLTGIA
ncbi:MAG: DUF5017 domain-containing protein, partial [Bacteroidales bacterium]|nr:DUF5017 domain-containing protein [Bacteroidales bacterium]